MNDQRPVPPSPKLGGWTTNQVVTLLLSLAEELQKLNDELEVLERDSIALHEDYNRAHAQALLRADGKSQALREAQADLATADERLASKLAEANCRATKRKCDILRERVGIGRSIVSSLRSELELERGSWR